MRIVKIPAKPFSPKPPRVPAFFYPLGTVAEKNGYYFRVGYVEYAEDNGRQWLWVADEQG